MNADAHDTVTEPGDLTADEALEVAAAENAGARAAGAAGWFAADRVTEPGDGLTVTEALDLTAHGDRDVLLERLQLGPRDQVTDSGRIIYGPSLYPSQHTPTWSGLRWRWKVTDAETGEVLAEGRSLRKRWAVTAMHAAALHIFTDRTRARAAGPLPVRADRASRGAGESEVRSVTAEMTPGERLSLGTVVWQRMKVLRADVARRRMERLTARRAVREAARIGRAGR